MCLFRQRESLRFNVEWHGTQLSALHALEAFVDMNPRWLRRKKRQAKAPISGNSQPTWIQRQGVVELVSAPVLVLLTQCGLLRGVREYAPLWEAIGLQSLARVAISGDDGSPARAPCPLGMYMNCSARCHKRVVALAMIVGGVCAAAFAVGA